MKTTTDPNCLQMFSPATREWLEKAFPEPISLQRLGWLAVAAGSHALLAAPTGSGKTLAAFLWGLDSLARLSPTTRANRSPPTRAVYSRFLAHWQGLGGDQERVTQTLDQVIDRLIGVPLSRSGLLNRILPGRLIAAGFVADYRGLVLERRFA
jgi:hypothetical protein